MAFFPRNSSSAFGADFAPLFRLFDEGLADLNLNVQTPRHSPVRAFSPRFDVNEHKDSYTLDGELPGIEQKNIDIEFTDPHTLVIKGRIERESRSSTPAGVEDATPKASGAIEATPATSDDASSTKSSASSTHQPTVEDEDSSPTTTSPNNHNNNNNNELAPTPTPKTKEVTKPQQSQPQPQYKSWISERSVGEFHRSFSFPSRVDQDAVKASLKNGILSIVVPKAKAPESRRIVIE